MNGKCRRIAALLIAACLMFGMPGLADAVQQGPDFACAVGSALYLFKDNSLEVWEDGEVSSIHPAPDEWKEETAETEKRRYILCLFAKDDALMALSAQTELCLATGQTRIDLLQTGRIVCEENGPMRFLAEEEIDPGALKDGFGLSPIAHAVSCGDALYLHLQDGRLLRCMPGGSIEDTGIHGVISVCTYRGGQLLVCHRADQLCLTALDPAAESAELLWSANPEEQAPLRSMAYSPKMDRLYSMDGCICMETDLKTGESRAVGFLPYGGDYAGFVLPDGTYAAVSFGGVGVLMPKDD